MRTGTHHRTDHHSGTPAAAHEAPRSTPWQAHLPTAAVVVPLAAYFVLIPVFGSIPGFKLFNSQRVLQLVVLALATLPLAHAGFRGRWLRTFGRLPFAARAGFASIWVAGCVSAALSPLPRFAFLEVGIVTLLFVTSITMASVFLSHPEKSWSAVVMTLALGMGLYITSFAVGYVFSLAGGLPVWPKAFTGFVHVRMFNQYQVWTLALAVVPAMLVPAEQLSARRALFTMAALWYALLFASGGRGATLAMAGTFVLVLVVFRKHAFHWARLQAGAALIGLGLYVVLFVVLADNLSVFSRLQDITNGTGRVELWTLALDLVRQHPVLGEGPMQFARHINEHAAHPHNAVVQWAAEWGIPSAFVLLSLVGWGVWSWSAQCRRRLEAGASPITRLTLVSISATIACVGSYTLVDGVIVMPHSQILLAIFAGWVLALYLSEQPEATRPETARPEKRSALHSAMLGAVILLAWVGVSYAVAQDIGTLEVDQAEHVVRTEARLLHPRFWQQGFIEP